MGRLKQELIDRLDSFVDRVLDVVDALAEDDRPRRITDQLGGRGTAVGANASEADEALSKPDFCKCIGISLKEFSEPRFWLRLIVRRNWQPAARLADLQRESLELKRILGSIINRTRARTTARSRRDARFGRALCQLLFSPRFRLAARRKRCIFPDRADHARRRRSCRLPPHEGSHPRVLRTRVLSPRAGHAAN